MTKKIVKRIGNSIFILLGILSAGEFFMHFAYRTSGVEIGDVLSLTASVMYVVFWVSVLLSLVLNTLFKKLQIWYYLLPKE